MAIDRIEVAEESRAPPAAEGNLILPKAPTTIAQTGLSPLFLMDLAIKIIHYAESPTAEHVSRVIGLPTRLINEILQMLKADRVCEVIGSNSYEMASEFRYRLSERGERRAEQALDRCRYAGPAPVTVASYESVISETDSGSWRPSLEVARRSFESLVLDDNVKDFLERALCSGRSTMIFGPSGNGKTHLLSEFIRHMDGEVLIPHAIYAHGQIVRMYDPSLHVQVDGQPPAGPPGDLPSSGSAREDSRDQRWLKIKRPGIIVGGEVTAESLELGYDPVTRFYQAPKHLKALGGILVVDDFGRQRVGPAELLNRWIMALERGRDNLVLRTGESIEIPFHLTLFFSTNLHPAELADSAYLRRIPYKVSIPATKPTQFEDILRKVCQEFHLSFTEQELQKVISYIEATCGEKLSGSLARDLISILIENARHEGNTPSLTVSAVALAYRQFTGTDDEDALEGDVPALE